MTCIYCKRKSDYFYNQKRLCSLHYLLENPDRNKNLCDWDKLLNLKNFKPGEKKKLDKIRKTMKKLR